jgi:hypothetical protein
MRRLLVSTWALLLSVWLLGASLAQAPGGNTGGGDHPRTAPALLLHPSLSPDGTFTLALPKGWRWQQNQAGISATNGQLEVFIDPLLSFNDVYVTAQGIVRAVQACVQANLGTPGFLNCYEQVIDLFLALNQSPHSAAEGTQLLLSLLAQQGYHPEMRALDSLSPTEAKLQGQLVDPRGPKEVYADIRTFYMPNPVLGGEETFLFPSGCEAPHLNKQSLALCAAILASFRPRPTWSETAVAQLWQMYLGLKVSFEQAVASNILFQMGEEDIAQAQHIENLLAGFGNRIRELQMQDFARTMASNYQIAKGWINAYEGRVDLLDPESGKVYNVPDMHVPYYCAGPGAGETQVYGASNKFDLPSLDCSTGLLVPLR